MKPVLKLYLLASLLYLMVQPAAALESKKIYQLHENSVFQIRVLNRETGKKTSIGSGFIVGNGRQIATNFHVINKIILEPDLFYVTYLTKNGREGELKLLALDVVHDLALLVSDEYLGQAIATGDLPPKGAPVFAMGNPLDLGLSLAVGTNGGILNQTDDSRILFSGSLNPGMSGGPTFNENGEAIGINVATARNDISFIVPSKFLNNLITSSKNIDRGSSANLKIEVAEQLLAYEKNYIEGLLNETWPTIQLRQLTLPGTISPTVRCWDNSAKLNANALFKRYQIRCANKNHVYLDDANKFVGELIYEYYWLESDQLDTVRFHNLYQKLNKDQIENNLSQEEVSNFNCNTWFVEVSAEEFKVNLCRREYVEYAGLSDLLFTAALTGHDNQGFFITFIMTGTDFNATLPLVKKFLENVVWNP
ncbi:MAG: trypsin-like peptidase domain-containing protein [Proteobacteria bacterium]|nr:trypsin-like peptidase domain-containing protein [Pseudomonadota bacterium]